MKYSDIQIVLQEVPGEISICFSITGCSLRCDGCHSPHLWNGEYGNELSMSLYIETLDRYKSLASCVLFMGGEWYPDRLTTYLSLAKSKGFNTCLYTGEDTIHPAFLPYLTWGKTGRWLPDRGGLDSPETNQKFIEIQSGKIINNLFKKTHYDTTDK